MKKNLKIATGLLLVVGLLAAYAACSKSIEEESINSPYESSVSPLLKSAQAGCACGDTCDTSGIGTTIIYRDPSCTDGDCKAYRLLGINFNYDYTDIDIVNLCGSPAATCTTGYHMYFYNEKTGCSTASGQPLFILDSTRVQAVQVGTGYSDFLEFKCIRDTGSCYNWTSDCCFSLPLGTEYRCTSSCTSALRKGAVDTLTNCMVIGNDFQNTASDILPTYQPVYLLKIQGEFDPFYYVFMVYKFQNGQNPPEKKYMTIKYRKLGTNCPTYNE